jgi:hypothetical protein
LDSPFFFEGTTYWSQGDERAHFDWLGKIASIRDIRGQGRRVFLTIDRSALTAQDLDELNAVYRRYGGDLKQLEIIEEDVNAEN